MASSSSSSPRYIAAHWVFPVSAPPIPYGFVAINGNVITAIGAINQLAPSLQQQLQHQLPLDRTTFITPGLINTHTHLELTLPHIPTPIPINAGESMGDWLNKVITHRQHSPQSPLEHCINGAQQLLSTGTSTVNDISTFGESLHALAECGLRGAVSMEWFWPLWNAPTPEANIRRYWQHFGNKASPLLTTGLSPHAPYNVSPASWHSMVKQCQPGIVHTHVGESTDETHWLNGTPTPIDDVHTRFFGKPIGPQSLPSNQPAAGLSPYRYLQQHGCFNNTTQPVVLAHGVTLTHDDWQHIAANPHIGVSHCPRSNQWLHGRTLSASVPTTQLSLGTDSTLSNHNLDLRAEARWCQQHHDWAPETLLAMMTKHGAKQLGLQAVSGALKPGMAADVVLWHTKPQKEDLSPSEPHSPLQAMIEWLSTATHAQQVWVNGNVRYKKADTI